MPNRIIKESTFTSDNVALLSDFEFRLWVGLITVADDAGRGDARAAIIKGRVFALRERVTLKDIENALNGLAAKGCVSLYKVDGKPYFWFPTWSKHQRVRDCKTKYPSPDEADPLPQSAATCGSSPRNAAIIQSNTIQSESEYESNFSSEQILSSEHDAVVFTLPLNTGEDYPITASQVTEWEKLYPAVDIMQSLRAMKGWLGSNPKKRKTHSGILRFVNGWLAREQDRGWKKQDDPKSSNMFLDMLREEGQNSGPF